MGAVAFAGRHRAQRLVSRATVVEAAGRYGRPDVECLYGDLLDVLLRFHWEQGAATHGRGADRRSNVRHPLWLDLGSDGYRTTAHAAASQELADRPGEHAEHRVAGHVRS